MKVGTRKHEQATVEIVESEAIPAEMRGGVREVLRLYVPSHHRKKGLGQALLKKVCEEADNARIVLMIWPRAYGDGDMTTAQLIPWYRRFGFIETQQAPVLMMRQPRSVQVQVDPVKISSGYRKHLLAHAVRKAMH